ncbi:MAG TPA: ABC transporter permease [Leptospiraceae bacterium]|nr:ABC transporter permease [Leptospiraceae bacterium]HMW07147.1 ABC transporter permease [Leptospiraceae bacterium]HMX31821.1 ABC transporter permease [Leptospiraceae bacterium]HMY32536.1 ABC transporter permease [Leptospiraceae bacterium]HMZ67011.1 ABC transporter permease [Leptospiraceae bacterium]
MKFLQNLQVLWILVKRDYALQFAGSLLGVIWMLIQSLSLIAIYTFVFFILNKTPNLPKSQINFSSYIFVGLLFWIPTQEMMIRGVSILTDNRQLIKRSTLKINFFLWIPFVQMMLHSFVISIPIFLILAIQGSIDYRLFLLGYLVLFFTGLYLMLVLEYLARLNILLKDISPIIRLFAQIIFWTLPILYFPDGVLKEVNNWNPFVVFLDLFRFLILKEYALQFPVYFLFAPLFIFLFIFILTHLKFDEVVMDHL